MCSFILEKAFFNIMNLGEISWVIKYMVPVFHFKYSPRNYDHVICSVIIIKFFVEIISSLLVLLLLSLMLPGLTIKFLFGLRTLKYQWNNCNKRHYNILLFNMIIWCFEIRT